MERPLKHCLAHHSGTWYPVDDRRAGRYHLMSTDRKYVAYILTAYASLEVTLMAV